MTDTHDGMPAGVSHAFEVFGREANAQATAWMAATMARPSPGLRRTGQAR